MVFVTALACSVESPCWSAACRFMLPLGSASGSFQAKALIGTPRLASLVSTTSTTLRSCA